MDNQALLHVPQKKLSLDPPRASHVRFRMMTDRCNNEVRRLLNAYLHEHRKQSKVFRTWEISSSTWKARNGAKVTFTLLQETEEVEIDFEDDILSEHLCSFFNDQFHMADLAFHQDGPRFYAVAPLDDYDTEGVLHVFSER